MKPSLRRLTALCLTLLLVVVSFLPARADVAPPEAPPGSSLLPGSETTQVSMLAETVTMTVSQDPSDKQGAVAMTVASFTMRNLGTTTEQLQARFPVSFLQYADPTYPEISDLAVKVDGQPVSTARQVLPYTSPGDFGISREDIPWDVFDVSFPPGQDVNIQVTYSTYGYGYYPNEEFRYILETGAGWKGPIGSADVIVRLPYDANEQSVPVGDVSTGYGGTTGSPVFIGNEVRWHFDNLEPTTKDNISVVVISPALWQSVLKESATVAANPSDGEAWGRLAKAYKEIILMPKGFLRDDASARRIYELSKQDYERCLSLLPDDSLWHTGYADLLWAHYYFDFYMMGAPDTEGLLTTILTELQTAMRLDPHNERATELLDWISSAIPDAVTKTDSGYEMLGLTATVVPPTGYPTPVPDTLVPATPVTPEAPATPVSASVPTSSPQPVSTPASRVYNPLCGGPGLLLAGLAAVVWMKRRK